MLIGGNEIGDRKRLWEWVVYYYFIQNRMMQALNNDALQEQDCRHVWSCFLEVVTMLQPTDCLVLGTRNETAFGASMEQAGWSIEDCPEPVGGRAKPRYVTITWTDGHTLTIWFMQHPSRCSPTARREFFREKMLEAMKLF